MSFRALTFPKSHWFLGCQGTSVCGCSEQTNEAGTGEVPGVGSPVQCSIFTEAAPADPVGDVPTGLQDKVPFAVQVDEDVSVYREHSGKTSSFH